MSNNKFKFELNREGVRELMQSEKMQEIVSDCAESVRDISGEGYEVVTNVGRTRATAKVHPSTAKAYYSNRKHKTLQKALGRVKI